MELMALTDGQEMVMPVAPAYGGGNGFGNFGGDWGWIILLLLCAGGGWGNGFGGGYNNALGYDFPWLLNGQSAIANNTNNGFQNAMINDGITSIRDGIGNLSTQICNSFAQAEISDNARQIADMQQAFASQTAVTGAINDLQGQLAQCCCDNRLATCQTQNIVQNEGNATRFADANNTRDIIENANRNNQAILDKLCALEIDAKNDKIADLERQLAMANLSASQTAQTSRILADNTAQTVALEQYLNPTPIPAYVVQNPNCCSSGCSTGCGSF